MQLRYIIVIFLVFQTVIAADTYIKSINRLDPDALCLDGQQAFVYIK